MDLQQKNWFAIKKQVQLSNLRVKNGMHLIWNWATQGASLAHKFKVKYNKLDERAAQDNKSSNGVSLWEW